MLQQPSKQGTTFTHLWFEVKEYVGVHHNSEHPNPPVSIDFKGMCWGTNREIGTTSRESMPVWELCDFCLTSPGSTTYTTPSTVMLVSAILVATMTRRQLGGPGANTLACHVQCHHEWYAQDQDVHRTHTHVCTQLQYACCEGCYVARSSCGQKGCAQCSYASTEAFNVAQQSPHCWQLPWGI